MFKISREQYLVIVSMHTAGTVLGVQYLGIQSNDGQKQLYNKYTSDYWFHGYMAIKGPKALIPAFGAMD